MILELEAHLFPILENQAKLFRFLGDYTWQLNLDSGKLTFRSRDDRVLLSCPVQLFGTRSEQAPTFLWAWANRDSSMPAELLQGVSQLREEARREKKAIFGVEDKFHLPYENYDIELAILCAGALEQFTYYACHFEQGCLYAGIEECSQAEKIERDAQMVFQVISAGASKFRFDHGRALLAYLGKPIALPAEVWRWNIGREQVSLKIDHQGKITNLEVSSRGK